MIDFKAAPLLLPADEERAPRLALPALPRAQFSLWPTIPMTVIEPKKKPAPNLQALAFRQWLGFDPATLSPDDRAEAARDFREATRKRTWRRDKRRPGLRTVARKVSKPRSLGLFPSTNERLSWRKGLRLPVMPQTRGECPTTRPCTFVRCRYHLKLFVDDDQAIRLPDGGTTAVIKDLFPLYRETTGRDGAPRKRYVYPGMPLEAMPATCALDVADEGWSEGELRPLEQVGALVGVTMERARQLQEQAVEELRAKLEPRGHVSRRAVFMALARLAIEWRDERAKTV